MKMQASQLPCALLLLQLVLQGAASLLRAILRLAQSSSSYQGPGPPIFILCCHAAVFYTHSYPVVKTFYLVCKSLLKEVQRYIQYRHFVVTTSRLLFKLLHHWRNCFWQSADILQQSYFSPTSSATSIRTEDSLVPAIRKLLNSSFGRIMIIAQTHISYLVAIHFLFYPLVDGKSQYLSAHGLK